MNATLPDALAAELATLTLAELESLAEAVRAELCSRYADASDEYLAEAPF